MTTPKKTPAKRTGPTRAAALKALGLTAGELKDLQNLQAALQVPTEAAEEPTHEAVITQAPPTPIAEKFYVRNLHSSPLRVKTEEGKSHQLKPRGYRGDFSVLKSGDEHDSNILASVEAGMVEVISHSQASSAITKQHKNASSHDHLVGFLRDQHDKPFKNGAVMASEEETQGITVGHLNSEGGLGREGQKGRGMDWNAVKTAPEAPSPMDGMTENQKLQALDAAARSSHNSENPLQAALGGLKISQ